MTNTMIPTRNSSNITRRSSNRPSSLIDAFFGDSFLRSDWDTGYDVIEHDDSYEYRFDFPGFSKDDISINLDKNGSLNISSTVETESEDEDVLHRGRKTRRYSIPAGNLDPEEVKAKMDKGVLSLQIPKKSKSYEIEIE